MLLKVAFDPGKYVKVRVWFYQTIVSSVVLRTVLKILKITYFFWRHSFYFWNAGCIRTALQFLLHLTQYVNSLLITSMPTCDAFQSSCWILYRSGHWLAETDFLTILKISSFKTSEKNGLLFQLGSPAFIPWNAYHPFVIIKPLFLGVGSFFKSVCIPGYALGVYITKNANKLKLQKVDTCYCCLEGRERERERTPTKSSVFCVLFCSKNCFVLMKLLFSLC